MSSGSGGVSVSVVTARLVDRVAEAIWQATVPAAAEKSIEFREMADSSQKVFRTMAHAAIDALGFTEETTTRPILVYDDPPTPKDNHMVIGPDRFWATHFEFVPSSRLVSEWQPRMEHADSMRPWEVS